VENISLNKYIKLLINNYKIIVYFTAGMVVLAILTGIILYEPSYQSTAKLMIKETSPNSFIVPLEEGSRVRTSSVKNPILNYMQIFSSKKIAENTVEKIADDPFINQYPKKQLTQVINSRIDLENIPGTDIILFSFKWKKPDEAQKIAEAYIDSFMAHNVETNKKSISQMRNYIEGQLAESEKELEKVRNKIKDFKTENKSVNVDQEAIAIIQQITANENDLAEIKKELNSERSKSSDITTKLGLDTEKALISAALGQNDNLKALRRDLQVAQQKYADFNTRYTQLNPRMKSLIENINEIKKQMKSQVKLTLGNEIFNEGGSLIADPVRTNMVSQLVESQSNIQALEAQKNSVEGNLTALMKKQSAIPQIQSTLQDLIQRETTLAEVVKTLNTKLIESKIRESEIISNLTVVDEPTLPVSPTFPTIFHIIILFGFTGMLLGIGTVLGKHYVEDTAQGTQEIEDILKAPVLGIIPWIREASYTLNVKEFNPASIINIVYQKIITSLKIKAIKKNTNVISITSADFEKRRSVISANIAKNLAKAGNSVLLIDSDFRSGCIAKEFGINTEEKIDFTDILLGIAKVDENKQEEMSKILNSGIIRLEEYKNLYLIPNNNSVSNPDQIVNLPAFGDLITFVKENFDYVIIDTPPLLAVSDSITISQHIDGLVLLCGIKTSRSNLARVKKICDENYIDILGAIARDSLTELEIPENMYIRQLNEAIS